MSVRGRKVDRYRWVHGTACVVRVKVEAIIPVDDPSEACYPPATVRFLRTVREKADNGDVAWLRGVGDVFVRLPAA